MKKTLLILAAASTFVLAGCDTGDMVGTGGTSEMEDAYSTCDPSSLAVELADSGKSIVINGAMPEDLTDIACIMIQLETPEYIISEVDNTTAMMGRQHEDAGGYSYEWSYHPDNGLDMVIHET